MDPRQLILQLLLLFYFLDSQIYLIHILELLNFHDLDDWEPSQIGL